VNIQSSIWLCVVVVSAVPDEVTLTQSSDDAASSEATDLLRSVIH